MTSPSINPSKTVHTPPQTVKQVNRLTPKQIGAVGEIVVDLILAEVCLAIGGVSFSILGQTFAPFNFLNGWAANLTDKAQHAYISSFAVVDVANGNAYGTTTAGTAVQVYNATATVNATAQSGVTNAGTANTNIQSTWNAIYTGAGGTGSGNQTITAAQTQLGAVTLTGTTNTGNIQSTWNGIYTASGGTASGDQTLSTAQTKLSTVTTTASSAAVNAQGAIDGINQAVTGTGATGATAGTVATNITTVKNTATTASTNAQGAIDGINQAVTGTTASGATAGTVKTNIQSIKGNVDKNVTALNALRAGYTVDTITSDRTWTKPTGITELYVALWSAGAKGGNGATPGPGGAAGGTGGAAGQVIAAQLQPSAVPDEVTCTVSVGNTTTPTATSFGSIITTDDAYKSYVSTPLGLMQTYASPAAGGKGGTGTNGSPAPTAGATGSSTQFGVPGGAGGAAGASGPKSGLAGSTGGGGVNFGLCQTGGAGGGGGGGGYTVGNGGAGGAGGFPGGGGGGGGGSMQSTGGTGGNGGYGLILVVYKKANES